MIGVAISTTGDRHRLPLLARCAEHWWLTLTHYGLPTQIFVTVDGDEAAYERVQRTVFGHAVVARVGQGRETRAGRQGVAVNKNTGIELLIDAGVTELFLSDDDTWPLSRDPLDLHLDLGLPHSLLCWGAHRMPMVRKGIGSWRWPRGAMIYVEDTVIDALGGMDERFGPGGHEHVEYSRRIYQAGFTPHPYPTPPEYTLNKGMEARLLWHAEDMPRRGEPRHMLQQRRQELTSVRRRPEDWALIEGLFAERDHDTSFVPYRAAMNGRTSATMSSHTGA